MAVECRTGSTSSPAKRIMLFSGPGTRRWPRINISEITSIKGIRLISGARIRIVNMSRGGVLLQTRRHIARGTEIDLILNMAEGTVQLTGWVLRSTFSSKKGIPQYHAAVAFNHILNIFDELPWPVSDASQAPAFKSSPSGPFPPDRWDAWHKPFQDEESAMIAAFFAITFYNAPDAALDEMSRLNDW
ncbi:MAG TPA: hypothetical protein VMG30_15035 [Acidobacteriota bacterium]|nr:hypothetical protein [Acidobacteriota bacterium]